MAPFECLHEAKLTVDLIYEGVLPIEIKFISNTAEYGDLTRGTSLNKNVKRKQIKDVKIGF